MESEWELDRMKLYQLRCTYPEWTLSRLAKTLKRSLSWVKKWLKRFREAGEFSLDMFKSQSRAPHSRPRQVVDKVRDAVLSLRDQLRDKYGRVVGAKPILYHLHRDTALKRQGVYLPKSTRTIWKILKDGGRIQARVKEHFPLERPDPMQHWEMDFGQLGDTFEFLTVMDRGTSILVHTKTQPHFNAESALLAVASLLIAIGLPIKLRFDNDTRFVGSWLSDGFPSPLMRFLVCLGIEPDIVEPGKPYHKPYAERNIRTLKHECLWEAAAKDWLDADSILEVYRHFYNNERANQSSACGNCPPYEVFPQLPILDSVPDMIDPDAWLIYYDNRLFKRRVGQNGVISVGNHDYYVGYKHARKKVGVWLDAKGAVYRILAQGTVLCEQEIQGVIGHSMPFQEYLKLILTEAQTIPAN